MYVPIAVGLAGIALALTLVVSRARAKKQLKR